MKRLVSILSLVLALGVAVPVHAQEDYNIIDPSQYVQSAGTYFIGIGTEGTDSTALVAINVKYPGTVISEENQEGIDAHDFRVGQDELGQLTQQQLIEKAAAHAWRLSDGSSIPVSRAVVGGANETGGYAVTYSTESGTAVTVTAVIMAASPLEISTQYVNVIPRKKVSLWTVSKVVGVLLAVPGVLIVILYFLYYKKFRDINKTLYC